MIRVFGVDLELGGTCDGVQVGLTLTSLIIGMNLPAAIPRPQVTLVLLVSRTKVGLTGTCLTPGLCGSKLAGYQG